MTPMPDSEGEPGPLEGLRVLDITAALAGPYTTLLLGFMGAEVIKVEAPGGSDMGRLNPPYACGLGIHFDDPVHPDDISLSSISRLRNKKSITIDGKTAEGRELLLELARRSDILVQNMRPDSMLRIGLDYESVRQVNPDIVYCSITAFDPEVHGQVGMDIMVQALSGLMYASGFPDGPPIRAGIPIGDLITPLYACVGILGAIHMRNQGRGGQRLQVSMLDALTSVVAGEHFDAVAGAGLPIRTGNSSARMSPFGSYQTKDGYVAIAASQDKWCNRLFAAMDRLDLLRDERLNSRWARSSHSSLMDSVIEQWSHRYTSDELMQLLRAHDVPAAKVREPQAATDDPSVRSGGAVVPLVHPWVGNPLGATNGLPIRFGRSTAQQVPTRPLGSDTDEVLRDVLGLSPDRLADLHAHHVV